MLTGTESRPASRSSAQLLPAEVASDGSQGVGVDAARPVAFDGSLEFAMRTDARVIPARSR